ncbi:dCTP pyrophosphatase 1-like protein [Leptotrombidium deliense]|uniref:dCTP pyrophosphatase 1 n=1 Tax=Leptotrombidium deliense TaxID=299467 RepID=A0A443SUG3_9ACAR|nr:dCTP pyrophosphatase 1-like protein [Leptotrombidium deliense]
MEMNCNSEKSEVTGTNSSNFQFSSDLSLEKIRALQSEFCEQRNWRQYHTPRNLLLALTGEVGELAEIFQWKRDEQCDVQNWTNEQRAHLGDELSDVLIYLIRMADICKIDLCSAVLKKIEKNAMKYPVDKVYGSSKKYNEYNEHSEHNETIKDTKNT